MAASVIAAVLNRLESFAGMCPVFFGEAPVVKLAAAGKLTLPYLVLTDEGLTPAYEFEYSATETTKLKVEVYATTLAAADAITEVVKYNGQPIEDGAGLDFAGELPVDNRTLQVVQRDREQRVQEPDRYGGDQLVFRNELEYAVVMFRGDDLVDGGTLSFDLTYGLVKGTQPAQGAATSGIPKPFVTVSREWDLSAAFGAATGQFQAVAVIENTLAASASVTYDLYGGTLLDVFGAAMPLRTLVAIVVQQIDNADATPDASGLTVGNAGSNPHGLWFGAPTVTQSVVGVAGFPLAQGDPAGKPVTSTARNVLITNPDSVNKATYRLLVAGRLV